MCKTRVDRTIAHILNPLCVFAVSHLYLICDLNLQSLHLSTVRLDAHLLDAGAALHRGGRLRRSRVAGILNAQTVTHFGLFQTRSERRPRNGALDRRAVRHARQRRVHRGHAAAIRHGTGVGLARRIGHRYT